MQLAEEMVNMYTYREETMMRGKPLLVCYVVYCSSWVSQMCKFEKEQVTKTENNVCKLSNLQMIFVGIPLYLKLMSVVQLIQIFFLMEMQNHLAIKAADPQIYGFI